MKKLLRYQMRTIIVLFQAERQSKIPCPTDTGFFSPSSEEAPVILSEQSSASTTTSKADGHLTPSPQPPTDVSIRYNQEFG